MCRRLINRVVVVIKNFFFKNLILVQLKYSVILVSGVEFNDSSRT